MDKVKTIKKILILSVILYVYACSTQKNTQMSRGYHTTTSYFNVYFNANQYLKEGIKQTDKTFVDNFSKILPVFNFSENGYSAIAEENWNKTIEKCQKTIIKHSIRAKPELPKGRKLTKEEQAFFAQKEFVRYVKDAYLSMGIAHTFKQEYEMAILAFEKITLDFPKEPVAVDAKLWLAVIHLKEEEPVKTQGIIDPLENDKNLTPQQQVFLKKIITELAIYNQQYLRASTVLQSIIPQIKDKNERTRCRFILGQLYESLHYDKNAIEQYNDVIKNGVNYDLRFFATLQKLLLEAKSGKNLQKDLQKLLNDDKNIDYYNRIYYGLGKIEEENKQYDKAIDYYKLSVGTEKKNSDIQAKSYLKLAEIYEFQKGEYLLAQAYYDTTTKYLPPSDTLYAQVSLKAKNLDKLAQQLKTILLQDSLLRVSKLSIQEQKAWAESVVKSQKENSSTTSSTLSTTSKWYFYNPTIRQQGYKTFKEQWGERALQDNWRTQSGGSSSNVQNSKSTTPEKSQTDIIGELLQTLPTTPEAKKESEQTLCNALFNAGEIYMSNMNDYPAAIKQFLRIDKDFPQFDKIVEVNFYLYQMYTWTSQPENANKHKNFLINHYPEHLLTKYCVDPNFLSGSQQVEKEAQQQYDRCMTLYHQQKYADVVSSADNAIEKYTDLPIKKNFELLRAMAVGGVEGLSGMLSALEQVSKKYKDTEIGNEADERYKSLKSRELALIDEQKNAPFLPPINLQDTTDLQNQYSDRNESYYFAVVVGKGADINQLKFNILVFHADLNDDILQVDSEIVSDDLQIVYVKTFTNKKEANSYYRKAANNRNLYEDIKTPAYTVFTISKSNFDIFLKDKTLSRYMVFFRKFIENKDE